MARDHRAAASPRRVSCERGSSSRSGQGVGTWLKVAAVGLVFFTAGAVASDPYMGQRGGIAPAAPKYGGVLESANNMRFVVSAAFDKLRGKDSQMYTEMNSVPPKPLQVFEYGPSRPVWYRNPTKYKYQYVCVVATMGPVEEGIWHRRRAPVRWKRQPPFHVRIVRPNPAGMLDYMMAKGKLKLAKKTVTIRRTDKRTGRVIQQTKPMVVVERADGANMPDHIAEMLEAHEEGRDWKDPRPSKGRWGPSNIEEVKEEGIMELLAEAGIETPEEIDDVTKVIDKTTGETFDLKKAFDYGDTAWGYKRWRDALIKNRNQEEKEEKRREKRRQQ